MDLKQYVASAIETESRITKISFDLHSLVPLLKSFVAAGNLIDVVKKDTFYGLPKDADKLAKRNNRVETNTQDFLTYSEEYFDSESSGVLPVSLPNVNPRLAHAIIGLATESVELIEALLEAIQTGGPIDEVNILEELGDLNWYHAIAIDALNADWTKVQETNISKLRARNKGNAFNAEATIDRDTDAERLLLETQLGSTESTGPK